MSLLIGFLGAAGLDDIERPEKTYALAAARKQGFDAPVVLRWPSGQAWWFSTSNGNRGSGAVLQQGNRFAAYVGSVHWRGLTGVALLKILLAEFERPEDMPLQDFSGAFAMLFAGASEVHLFVDAVGIQKIYHSEERKVFSTSFLVCRSMLTRARVHRQKAQEYVLLGGSHGLETAVEGVRILDPTRTLELQGMSSRLLHAPERWRVACTFTSLQQTADGLATRLADDFRAMVQAFGGNIGMALSGGFDSRLLLATLDHIGIAPTLFVYGGPADEDVQVARRVAASMQLTINVVDKRTVNDRQPPFDSNRLARSVAFLDGLPTDGAFDRGADCITRLEQVHGGRLNLNGGGGEILRNFFYLRHRSFKAADVVSAFYSNWLPQAIASSEERRAFKRNMVASILASLGLAEFGADAVDRPLARTDVELIYSLLRLRFWMGRNNTVAARHGAFLTPLVHPRLIQLAAALPMQWKDFGRLEAKLIHHLSPRVAATVSNYGFNFTSGPGLRHRLALQPTMWRPLALRSRSAPLKRLLGRLPTAAAPAEWLAAAGGPPAADWIDAAFLTDLAQVNRLMTLNAVLDRAYDGAV